jgi:hypothetical protein
MNIQVLEAAEEDFPVVQNLVRFYVYDMSESMGWPCPEDGLYGGCDDLPEYWWTGSTPEELEVITESGTSDKGWPTHLLKHFGSVL